MCIAYDIKIVVPSLDGNCTEIGTYLCEFRSKTFPEAIRRGDLAAINRKMFQSPSTGYGAPYRPVNYVKSDVINRNVLL